MNTMLYPPDVSTQVNKKIAAKQLRAFQEQMDKEGKLAPAELNGEPEDDRTLAQKVQEREYEDEYTSNLLIWSM